MSYYIYREREYSVYFRSVLYGGTIFFFQLQKWVHTIMAQKRANLERLFLSIAKSSTLHYKWHERGPVLKDGLAVWWNNFFLSIAKRSQPLKLTCVIIDVIEVFSREFVTLLHGSCEVTMGALTQGTAAFLRRNSRPQQHTRHHKHISHCDCSYLHRKYWYKKTKIWFLTVIMDHSSSIIVGDVEGGWFS